MHQSAREPLQEAYLSLATLEHRITELRAYRKERRKNLPHIVRASDRANFAKRKAYKLQSSGSFTPQQWLDLKAQYNFTCLHCRKQEPEIQLHADHVIPLSREGSNDISNIQPLCKRCNCSKRERTIDYRPLWERKEQ